MCPSAKSPPSSSLKDKGLDGVEAWHPNAPVRSCKRYEAAAVNLGLCITAGSDYHGERRKDRKLGYTAGGRKIDDRFLPGALNNRDNLSR